MRIASACVVLGLLAAAGCGGGGGPSPETRAWASSVCTGISEWQTKVQSIAENAAKTITSGSAERGDVKAAVDKGLKTSRELVDELRSLGPPPTTDGDAAKQIVESFASGVQMSIDAVQRAVAQLPDNPTVTQIVSGLSGLATSVQKNVSSAGTTVEQLRGLGGDLKDAFDEAEACKSLRGGAGD